MVGGVVRLIAGRVWCGTAGSPDGGDVLKLA